MGILFALAAEGLLILLLLTLGRSISGHDRKGETTRLVSFHASDKKQDTEQAQADRANDRSAMVQERQSATKEAAPVPPRIETPSTPPPPALIRLSPADMAAADIRPASKAPSNRPAMGPPDTGPIQRDTPRVSGSGPNGEPLYAASWYREPYDDELRGYLSTASGPGWGLIACRTAPDFHVEDCIKLDEYPTGSNIARAVLAAAWQFQVRPPRIGGQDKIGEWVRIRIDYEFKAR